MKIHNQAQRAEIDGYYLNLLRLQEQLIYHVQFLILYFYVS